MIFTYARTYAACSVLLALTVIATPFLVSLFGVPNALFKEIFITVFPIWFLVSLVSLPAFRREGLPLLAPASFIGLAIVMFGLTILVGEANPERQVREFWIPAFMWLFMFYWGTVSWLLFAETLQTQ